MPLISIALFSALISTRKPMSQRSELPDNLFQNHKRGKNELALPDRHHRVCRVVSAWSAGTAGSPFIPCRSEWIPQRRRFWSSTVSSSATTRVTHLLSSVRLERDAIWQTHMYVCLYGCTDSDGTRTLLLLEGLREEQSLRHHPLRLLDTVVAHITHTHNNNVG